MNRRKKLMLRNLEQSFLLTTIFFSLSGLMIVFIPLVNNLGSLVEKIFSYFVAGVFWVGIIVGIVYLNKTRKLRQAIEKMINDKKDNLYTKQKIHWINLFSNPVASFFDLVMLISICALIILLITGRTNNWIIVFAVWILLYSIGMHFLFNSRSYKTILFTKKIFSKERKQYVQEK